MPEPWLGEARSCPSCGGPAEPEEDGEVRWWACACGYEFGYEQASQQDVCAAGVPLSSQTPAALGDIDVEGLRRAMRVPHSETPVFLGGIGRRPQ